jgi:mannose-6-phosphate isomerase-like protein (cupin superfamily)
MGPYKILLQKDADELYFVLEGTGRIRVGGEALTIPRHGALLVGPSSLRQVFNDRKWPPE